MRTVSIVALLILSLTPGPTAAAPDSDVNPVAVAIVEKANSEILRIQQQNPRLDRPTEIKLGQVLESVTHFQKMAEDILEPYAANWTIGEWRELGGVLGNVIKSDSLWSLKPYRVDRFEIVSTETVFRTVVVKVKAHYRDEETTITYHLDRWDGIWYVVNYIVDGISVIDAYEKHYDSLFKIGFLRPIIDQLERDVAAHPAAKSGL